MKQWLIILVFDMAHYSVEPTLFVKEEQFADYSKGRKVTDCPNPYVKYVDGDMVHIIPTNEKIVFKVMTDEEKAWYGVRADGVVYEGSVTVLGFFPTELVCGVLVRPGFYNVFSANSPLAKKTGWVDTNGMFGSRNDAFTEKGVKTAARILKKWGFNVEFV